MPLLAWHEMAMHSQLFNIHSIDIVKVCGSVEVLCRPDDELSIIEGCIPCFSQSMHPFLSSLTQRAFQSCFPAFCVSSSTFAIPLLPLR